MIEKEWEICRNRLAADHSRAELFVRYSKNKSKTLRNQLAIANDGLARREAHRQSQLCDVPFEDLVQIARIGLLQSIERYDISSGHAFSSFAIPCIRGEIQHFLRDHAWDMVKVPRRSKEIASAVKRLQSWAIAFGRTETTLEQAAISLGMTAEKWREISELTSRKLITELDDGLQAAAVAPDETHKQVRAAVAKLPSPYRGAIVGRYFKGLSEVAIAQQNKVERTDVCLWIEEGLRRLRSGHLGEKEIY